MFHWIYRLSVLCNILSAAPFNGVSIQISLFCTVLKEKCHQYWPTPPERVAQYQHMTVHLSRNESNVHPSIFKRVFQVSNSGNFNHFYHGALLLFFVFNLNHQLQRCQLIQNTSLISYRKIQTKENGYSFSIHGMAEPRSTGFSGANCPTRQRCACSSCFKESC